MPDITLYFLQASRSIRIAWLLEELGVAYRVEAWERENNKAPADFKAAASTALGKAPVLRDGELTILESGAITDYLVENYDPTHRLLPLDTAQRSKVRQWIHAAEGTFMVHCLAITYARWFSSPSSKTNGDLETLEQGLAINVQKDLEWLETELQANGGDWLVGEDVTAADTMVAFSVQFIFARGLGGQRGRWKGVDRWLENVEGREAYKRAVEKTGHKL
ncbi:glutathione S-transferase [Cryomyces antarcticus]|nr:hypothetical protein LTR04_004549 [Oleoguttula sp. CCFEE 6159]